MKPQLCFSLRNFSSYIKVVAILPVIHIKTTKLVQLHKLFSACDSQATNFEDALLSCSQAGMMLPITSEKLDDSQRNKMKKGKKTWIRVKRNVTDQWYSDTNTCPQTGKP